MSGAYNTLDVRPAIPSYRLACDESSHAVYRVWGPCGGLKHHCCSSREVPNEVPAFNKKAYINGARIRRHARSIGRPQGHASPRCVDTPTSS